jgi:hypothetical protein
LDVVPLALLLRGEASLSARQRTNEIPKQRKLASTYSKTWNRLQTELDTITRKYWAARQAGEAISPSWLFRQERYTALKQQVEAELRRLATLGSTSIVNEKTRAIELASGHAEQLTLSALGDPPPGLSVNWQRLPNDAPINMAGKLADGSALAELMQRYGVEAARGISDALTVGTPRRCA